MIELKVEDYCQECSDFSPMADTFTYRASKVAVNNTVVYCKNKKVCKRLYEHLKGENKE